MKRPTTYETDYGTHSSRGRNMMHDGRIRLVNRSDTVVAALWHESPRQGCWDSHRPCYPHLCSRNISGGALPHTELRAPRRTATRTLNPRLGNDEIVMRQHTFNFKSDLDSIISRRLCFRLVSKHRSCSYPIEFPSHPKGHRWQPQK